MEETKKILKITRKGLVRSRFETSLMSDNDWSDLYDFISKFEKPFTQKEKMMIYARCQKYADKYCVGKNAHKCINCGADSNEYSGLCERCSLAMNTSRTDALRGDRATQNKTELFCSACGKQGVYSAGLCRVCYRKSRKMVKLGISDNPFDTISKLELPALPVLPPNSMFVLK